VRLLPKSLAGRLALLLVLTLVVAQLVTFALFAGERIGAFHAAYHESLLTRLASLVTLIEEAPPALHDRLAATAGPPFFNLAVAPEPSVGDAPGADRLRENLAAALGKPAESVRVAFAERKRWRERRREDGPRRRPWAAFSIRLADGSWLNGDVGRPAVPPIGRAFLASFLLSAVAVAAVGAFGVRRASRPLRELASAADRLGRGETFAPLPETGPRETQRANVAFNRMRERLDRYVRDRTAMLAAVAHDLRTPITSLRLRAEFVEDEETKSKLLETLAEMQAMSEAALAFVRGDAEGEPTSATDLTALVESVVEDAAEAGRDAILADSPKIVLACRRVALKRAIANLIDNATLYGLRARVALETAAAPSPFPLPKGERVPEEIRIVIDDDGPGIPEADLERVFDPFVRLEASRSRETGGAGLGLAIARSIVRAHGGDVRLANRLQGGLRAVVTLPRGDSAAEARR
jgi:signal transduction histidine kinase